MAEQHNHDTGDQNEHHAAVPTDEVTDPVCGMTIAPEDVAESSEHNGRTYYFCSSGCAERFRKEPTKYLRDEDSKEASCRHHHDESNGGTSHPHARATGSETESRTAGTLYTCPMHPEIEQEGQGMRL